MDISLMHAGLAAGAALAALPVILHLFMKQKPKHVIFPALRLIRERQKRAKKQLKIKNWLLLAARMLLLALMALALAQPTLNSDAALGLGEVSSAIALVVDTSLSMQYTDKGQDRLAEAKARAGAILKKSTDDSEIYVVDSANPVKRDALTPASALKWVDGLTPQAANRPLNGGLELAHQMVAASKLPRREVYILTDQAATAWELGSTRTAETVEKFRKAKLNIKTYVLRLAPKEPRNVAVVAAEPSSPTPSEGETVEVQATIRATGPATERLAEFYIDGEKAKRDQKPVRLPANGEQVVTFAAPAKLAPGLHQGMVRLGGVPDPMPFDDVRYFTFEVQKPVRVLIVADEVNGFDDGQFVAKSLAPYAPGGGGEATPGVGADPASAASAFRVDRQTGAQFAARAGGPLKDYACIFLLNLPQVAPADWSRLRSYVSDGGGVVIAPGERARPSGYEGTTAAALLPALLGEAATTQETTFAKADLNHPLFSKYPKYLDPELGAFPIYRHWPVRPITNNAARTLLRYADGSPALLERVFPGAKAGHVLLWTTPLSRRLKRGEPGAWGDFPQSWSFLSLMLETVPYLAGVAGTRLNFEAGQDAVLRLDPAHKAPNYAVQGPDPKLTERVSVPATADALVVATPQKPGQWAVEGQAPDATKVHLGFSLNPPAAESQVVALKPGDLDGLFGGKDRYQEADDPASLERAQSKGRYGVELFPWLMFLILALVTAENLLANKFHRERGAA